MIKRFQKNKLLRDKLESREIQHFLNYSIDCLLNYYEHDFKIPDVCQILKILNYHSGEKELDNNILKKITDVAAQSITSKK